MNAQWTDAEIWPPLLMNGPMVRAMLLNASTETRRPVTRLQSLVDGHGVGKRVWDTLDFDNAWVDPGPSPAGNAGPYLKVPRPELDTVHRVYPRVWKGDLLWVRETWRPHENDAGTDGYLFRADGHFVAIHSTVEAADRWLDRMKLHGKPDYRWRPSIHMPRDVCRIERIISSVGVEHVQDITEAGAVAEGMETVTFDDLRGIASDKAILAATGSPIIENVYFRWDGGFERLAPVWSARERFRIFWELAYPGSWERNDWVWVISWA